MLGGFQQEMQCRYRAGTVDKPKDNKDNVVQCCLNYSPLLSDAHLIALHCSTLRYFSGRQATDLVKRGVGVYPDCLGVKVGLHPEHVALLSLGHIRRQTSILTFSPIANSELPVKVNVSGVHSKNCCDLT